MSLIPGTVYQLAARLAHQAEPLMASAWRWGEYRFARDDTAGSAGRSCLVIAPHPDDETIGCGATIARKRAAGTPVRVVIVADGRYAQRQSRRITPDELAVVREAEVVEACGRLGVADTDITQLGYEDTLVERAEAALADQLLQEMIQFRPEEVLVVSGLDHHPDHRAVHRAAASALFRMDERPLALEYPVWSWIDGPWLDQRTRSPLGRAMHLALQPLAALLRGRASMVRTGAFHADKERALAAHASQTTAYTDEPDWAIMDERFLGVFRPHAELFLPLRAERG